MAVHDLVVEALVLVDRISSFVDLAPPPEANQVPSSNIFCHPEVQDNAGEYRQEYGHRGLDDEPQKHVADRQILQPCTYLKTPRILNERWKKIAV